jgi:hypothetical protein
MSYTPPDPFQHHTINNSSTGHTRQSSLPTVYEQVADNDPYRIHKKSPRLGNKKKKKKKRSISPLTLNQLNIIHNSGSISDASSELDATLATAQTNGLYHSRTASDSSTSILYGEQARANSYLPYSHHTRDPNQNSEPIYIDNDITARATSSLGVGSMLHEDNYMINNNISNNKLATNNDKNNSNAITEEEGGFTDKMLSQAARKKKNRKRRFCWGYLRYRTLALIIFLCIAIIVVIWYFVWPRIPNLILDDIDNVGTIQVIANTTDNRISTNWLLNLTADNSNNWVPTRITSIDLFITDDITQQQFGNGTSGFIILPPRKTSIIEIPLSIYYESSVTNDTTFQDLYNACGIQVTSNTPSSDNHQDVLNVTLHVTFHISGLAWSTTRLMPIHGLVCPTS